MGCWAPYFPALYHVDPLQPRMAKSALYRNRTDAKHTGFGRGPCHIEHHPRMAFQRFHALDTWKNMAEKGTVLGSNDLADVLAVSGVVYLQHVTWRAAHTKYFRTHHFDVGFLG